MSLSPYSNLLKKTTKGVTEEYRKEGNFETN
jgi:hypothetical protein